MSTQALHPVISLVRRLTSSSVRSGTPLFPVDAARAFMASATIIAGWLGPVALTRFCTCKQCVHLTSRPPACESRRTVSLRQLFSLPQLPLAGGKSPQLLGNQLKASSAWPTLIGPAFCRLLVPRVCAFSIVPVQILTTFARLGFWPCNRDRTGRGSRKRKQQTHLELHTSSPMFE